jgi:hypothetical protein
MQLVLAAASTSYPPQYCYYHLPTVEYFYSEPSMKQYTLQRR